MKKRFQYVVRISAGLPADTASLGAVHHSVSKRVAPVRLDIFQVRGRRRRLVAKQKVRSTPRVQPVREILAQTVLHGEYTDIFAFDMAATQTGRVNLRLVPEKTTQIYYRPPGSTGPVLLRLYNNKRVRLLLYIYITHSAGW